jgi:hypothetical protein
MSQPSKKDTLASKLRSVFFFPIRLLVGFLVGLGKFRIWAAIVALIIVIWIGDLLTKDGLILTLFILGYALLYYLDRWFEKQENG